MRGELRMDAVNVRQALEGIEHRGFAIARLQDSNAVALTLLLLDNLKRRLDQTTVLTAHVVRDVHTGILCPIPVSVPCVQLLVFLVVLPAAVGLNVSPAMRPVIWPEAPPSSNSKENSSLSSKVTVSAVFSYHAA